LTHREAYGGIMVQSGNGPPPAAVPVNPPAFWLTPELNKANAAPVERDTRYSTAPDFQVGIVARRHGQWVTPT